MDKKIKHTKDSHFNMKSNQYYLYICYLDQRIQLTLGNAKVNFALRSLNRYICRSGKYKHT